VGFDVGHLNLKRGTLNDSDMADDLASGTAPPSYLCTSLVPTTNPIEPI
jgi:hypothetical protein